VEPAPAPLTARAPLTSSHTAHGTRAGDRNFGLPIWDTLFGTYVMPVGQRREQYGIDEPMLAGDLAQMAHPFRR